MTLSFEIVVLIFLALTYTGLRTLFGFFRKRRDAKQDDRLKAWLELFEPETKHIIKWWEEERRSECLSRMPNAAEHDDGFARAWRNIQSLEVEGQKATLWLYKPNGTFAATVDFPGAPCPAGFLKGLPGGPVVPRQELIKQTPEAAINDLRDRIKSPNYNG